jgi:hypothetical protein
MKNDDGTISILTSHQYSMLDIKDHTKLDYGDFDHLNNPQPIEVTMKIFDLCYRTYGPHHNIILTARNQSVNHEIRDYMASLGYSSVEVVTLADKKSRSVSADKAKWIKNKIDELRSVHFRRQESQIFRPIVFNVYEDSPKNLKMISKVGENYDSKDVVINCFLVSDDLEGVVVMKEGFED